MEIVSDPPGHGTVCYDLTAGALHEDVAKNGTVDTKTHQRA